MYISTRALLIIYFIATISTILFSGYLVFKEYTHDKTTVGIYQDNYGYIVRTTYCAPDNQNMPGIRINAQKGIRYETSTSF